MVSVVLCYKQETAYEMRISDWSSDVCSSDLFVGAGESARANYDTVSGFVSDADDTAGLQGTAFDVIDFGSGVMVNSALLEADGILDGFVQNDSALYDAIQSSTSVLAAVQLVEQELNTDPTANNGVLAFEYNGNTYIGDRKSTRLNSSH